MKHIFVLIGLQFFIIYSSFGLQAELGELVKKLSLLKGSLGVLSTRLGELKTKLTIKEEKKPVASGGSCHAPKIKTPLFLEIEKGIALKSASKRELAPPPATVSTKRNELLSSIRADGGKSLSRSQSVYSLSEISKEKKIAWDAKSSFIESKKEEISNGWNEDDFVHYPEFMTQKIKEGLIDGSFKLLSSDKYREVGAEITDLVVKFENNKNSLMDAEFKKLTMEYWKATKESEPFKQIVREELGRQAKDSWTSLGESGQTDQINKFKEISSNSKKVYEDLFGSRRIAVAGSDDSGDEKDKKIDKKPEASKKSKSRSVLDLNSVKEEKKEAKKEEKKEAKKEEKKEAKKEEKKETDSIQQAREKEKQAREKEKQDREKKRNEDREKSLIRQRSAIMVRDMIAANRQREKEKEAKKVSDDEGDWE